MTCKKFMRNSNAPLDVETINVRFVSLELVVRMLCNFGRSKADSWPEAPAAIDLLPDSLPEGA